MNQTNPQTSNAVVGEVAESRTARAEPTESLAAETLPSEVDAITFGDPRPAASLRLHAVVKAYLAARPAPTLMFPRFAPLPRELHQSRPRPRRPASRTRRGGADANGDRNQPTSAMPASASPPGPIFDGRRRKPIPPHGLRHWVLTPNPWLTEDEATRPINHFGTEHLDSFLRPNKGGPR